MKVYRISVIVIFILNSYACRYIEGGKKHNEELSSTAIFHGGLKSFRERNTKTNANHCLGEVVGELSYIPCDHTRSSFAPIRVIGDNPDKFKIQSSKLCLSSRQAGSIQQAVFAECSEDTKQNISIYREAIDTPTAYWRIKNLGLSLCLTHTWDFNYIPSFYWSECKNQGRNYQDFVLHDFYPQVEFHTPIQHHLILDDFQKIYSSNYKSTTKKPNIFLFFSDTTKQQIIGKNTPNIFNFSEKSISFQDSFSGATSTHHSLFSTFYSRNAYERDLNVRNGFNKGSPFLYILKKIGYKINFVGYNDFYFRYKLGTNAQGETIVVNPVPNSEYENNQVLFGKESYLMDRIGDIEPYYAEWRNTAEKDKTLVSKFKGWIQEDIQQNRRDGNLYVMTFYGLHPNFSFLESEPLNYVTPTFYFNTWPSGGAGRENIYTLNDTGKLKVRNTYLNAAISMDYMFGQCIDFLKKNKLYDDAIVVFFSDHGTLLFENNSFGHGGWPYANRSNVPIFYKFPTEQKVFANNGFTLDIFPSLLDYLKVVPEENISFKQAFYGQSIFNTTSNAVCPTTVTSAGYERHPELFSIFNNGYKITVQFTKRNIIGTTVVPVESDELEILEILDRNDNTIVFDTSSTEKYQKDVEIFLDENFKTCFSKHFGKKSFKQYTW